MVLPALGVVMHITGASYKASDAWFHNPSAGASAHLIIDLDGTIYQEVDFNDRAWAEGAGNPYYYSFETVGSSGPLTNAQVNSFARAYAWLAQKDKIPYQLADLPGQKGLGWHGMGGNAWGGHPYCPGEPRKQQRPLILQIAQGQAPTPAPPTTEETEVAKFVTTAGQGMFIDNGLTMRWLIDSDDVSSVKNTGEVTDPNLYGLPESAFYRRPLVGAVPAGWKGKVLT